VKSNSDINTRKSRKFPFDTVSMKKGDFMGRRAEVVLYRIYIVDGRHRYVRIVRSGRSWAPKTQPPGQPGAYYLRYRKNGRRTFESVGGDLSVALQEREARAKTLVGSTETLLPSSPSRKTLREHISQFSAKKDGLTKTERRRANRWRSFLSDFSLWWGREYIDEFRREDFDAFRKHLAATAKKSRTQRNLLSDLLTFLRGTGPAGSCCMDGGRIKNSDRVPRPTGLSGRTGDRQEEEKGVSKTASILGVSQGRISQLRSEKRLRQWIIAAGKRGKILVAMETARAKNRD
jgi:hypothetical protein